MTTEQKPDQKQNARKEKQSRQRLKTEANKLRRATRALRRAAYNNARIREEGYTIVGDASSGFTIRDPHNRIVQFDDMPESYPRYSDAYRALRGAGIPAKLIA